MITERADRLVNHPEYPTQSYSEMAQSDILRSLSDTRAAVEGLQKSLDCPENDYTDDQWSRFAMKCLFAGVAIGIGITILFICVFVL